METTEERDEVAEELKRFSAKYKTSSNQELRFLVNDYLVPMLETMREEYVGLVLDADEQDDEAVELADVGMNAVVALGQVLDALTKSGEAVPSELQKQFDDARALAMEFSSKARAVLEDVEEADDEGDEE